MNTIELSIVIPVYNSEGSLAAVSERICSTFPDTRYELILVDDGSQDRSSEVGIQLARENHEHVYFVQLSKNFGEHHAVFAGLSQTRGSYVAILDDDGQNPPEELPRMLSFLQRERLDVVYGRYLDRKHEWHRKLGSWFNDKIATILLGKPSGLYLSSFKIMNRFVVDEILKYKGSYPYLDGLICQVTNRLAQIDVVHHTRTFGKSGYTLRKLVRLWLNMFVGYSILPLRTSVYLGLIASMASVLWLFAIFIDRLWINPNVTVGIPTVLACMALFSGVQLMMLGMIGEYVGRIFLAGNGQPPYVIRPRLSDEANDE